MEHSYLGWLQATRGAHSWRQVAAIMGTTHSTIKRQLTNKEPLAIIDFARSLGANPLEGLVEAGILTEADVRDFAPGLSVATLSDPELAQLLLDRLKRREAQAKLEDENDDLEARRARALKAAKDERIPAQKRTPPLDEPDLP